ncbi:MAG: hypothetical protein J5627_03050 [Bacilli bacterium]|nr:hypothetical protein [Bacilli bacterium]
MKESIKKASVCGLLAFMLLSLPFKGNFPDEEVVPQEVAGVLHPPVTPLSRLRSQFESSSVSLSQDSLSFHGNKRAGHLFDFDAVECPNVLNYPVTFDFTYIVALDLGFLDISFINPVGDDVIASETVYVYPYDAGNGQRDIHFCLNDETFKATDFFAEPLAIKDERVYEVAVVSAHSIVSQAIYQEAVSGISFSYGDGSGSEPRIDTTTTGHMDADTAGIVYPTIAIAQILTSFDSAVGFAETHFPTPFFLPDPAVYFGYHIKMSMIKEDFRKNITLSIPVSSHANDYPHLGSQKLINGDKIGHDSNLEDPDEEAWTEWSFGFSNMADSGCPVFALYNLLVDLGYTPSLPVLIAFFELCNADLLSGIGGGCVLREENINEIKAIIDYAIIPGLAFLSAGLLCIPGAGPFLAFLTMSTAVMADAISDWLLYNQRGLGDVLDYLDLDHYEENVLVNQNSNLFGDFKTRMKPSGNGIMCFWNVVDGNLNIDYTHGAHFVCVRSFEDDNSVTCFEAYNMWGNSQLVTYYENGIDHLIYNFTDQQAERSMIAYYVLD